MILVITTIMEGITSKFGTSLEPIVPDPDKVIDDTMRFGGLDLAKRTDHSALEVLKIKNDILIEEAFMVWDHVNFGQVARDMHKIHKKKPMNIIGFDRTGVGDAAIELFDTITLPMEPVIMTNNRKIECVNAVQTMFQTGQLKISSNSPVREQLEMQQVKKSTAGNLIYEHPSGTHDDLFWGLAYAVYVAVPYIAGGDHPPIIRRGAEGLVNQNHDNTDELLAKLLGGNYGSLSEYDLNRQRRARLFAPRTLL